jgi:CBS domain-containing protein
MRACVFPGYGVSMFIGIGIPIPILDAEMAKFTAIRDRDIETEILDYGVPRRGRPVVRKVNYEELKSGKVEINGEEVRVSPLSSYSVARKIMEELKRRIEKGEFYLSEPIKRIPVKSEFKPMRQKEIVVVRNLMSPAIKIYEGTEIVSASKLIIEKGVNHLPVVDREGKLRGIVTSWDIAKAVAKGRLERVDEIMTKDVVTVGAEDPIEFAAEKLKRYNISALPVIDAKKRVLGMLTSEDISSLIARRG